MTDQRPARAGGPRRRTAAAPVAADPLAPTRPGWRPTRAARRRRRTPTPTSCCRRCCAASGLDGRDAGFATELAYGTTRLARPLRRRHRRGAGRPLDADRRRRARRAAARRPPAARHAGRRPRRGRRDRRPGRGMVNGAGAAGFVNAVLRRVSEQDLPTWVAQVVPDAATRSRRAGGPAQPPRWIVRGAAGGAARPRRVHRRDGRRRARRPCWRPTTRPPQVTLVARPGLADVDELVAAGADALGRSSPVGAVAATAATPAASPPSATGAPAVQDEGSPAGRPRAGRAEVADRADGRALARPVRRPRRQGGAARRAGARRRGATLLANEISEHRADLVRQTLGGAIDAGIEVMVGTGDGRELGEDEPGGLRPGARRRPVHRAGRAAPPARGALAAHARRTSPTSAALQRALLRLGARRRPARRRRRLRHLLPAPRRDPVRRRRRAQEAARTSSVLDARPLFADAAGAPVPTSARGPYVQLWPHLHGTDAMFLALLRKA